MNNIDKTLLLAESFGVDTSLFTSSYTEAIFKSAAFQGLTANVNWAQKFPLKKALALIEDYKTLGYKVSSFSDAVILSSRVNFLYTVSSEENYLNPLLKYSFKIRTKSIGDLKCPFGGGEASFNEIIADKDATLASKAHAIADKCEYYRKEMIEACQSSFAKTSSTAGIKHLVHKSLWSLFFKGLAALGAALACAFIFVSNRSRFTSPLVSFSLTSLWDWGIMVFIVSSALLVFSYLMLCAEFDRRYAPYYFFKRFGIRKVSKASAVISSSAQALAEYIFKAAESRTPLKNDIGRFASSWPLKEELASYGKMYSKGSSKLKSFFNGLYKIGIIFAALAALYLVVVFLIEKYL